MVGLNIGTDKGDPFPRIRPNSSLVMSQIFAYTLPYHGKALERQTVPTSHPEKICSVRRESAVHDDSGDARCRICHPVLDALQ